MIRSPTRIRAIGNDDSLGQQYYKFAATTLLLETVPLYLLFELSVVLASLAERRVSRSSRLVESI